MSTTNRLITRTLVAANDFRSVINRVVDYTGDFAVVGGHRAVGVTQSRCNSGQHLTVADGGDVKCIAGAVVTTPGYPLTTAASGYVVAAVSGSTVIGRYNPPSAAACASGDMVVMRASFQARPIGAGSGYV